LGSDLLVYMVTIETQVINTGGDGWVIIRYILINGDERYTKHDRIYMKAGETISCQKVFPEASLLSSHKFRTEAFAE